VVERFERTPINKEELHVEGVSDDRQLASIYTETDKITIIPKCETVFLIEFNNTISIIGHRHMYARSPPISINADLYYRV